MSLNLIPTINLDHSIREHVKFKYLLYFFIISNLDKEDGKLVCEYPVGDLYEKYKSQDADQIKNALKELEVEGLISVDGQTITVGVVEERKRVLYNGKVVSFDAEIKVVMRYADSFIKAFGTSIRSKTALRTKSTLEGLFNKPFSVWKVSDIIELYRCCYEVYYQEVHRELTSKEYGHFGNLLKYYDRITVAKMVVTYIFHNDTGKYGKAPSIATFYYYKDTLHADVKGLTNKGAVTTNTTDYEDDF